MPISHCIDRVRGRVLTRAEGLVTADEIHHHLDIQEVERGFELPELFDARGAVTNVTTDEVRRLVARARAAAQRMPLGPTAIVTDSEHVFEMARMYAILAEAGAPVEVFRELEAAVEWLDGWLDVTPLD